MARRHSETISPTAHYTGYVWFANGLSHPRFASQKGAFMYRALQLPNAIARHTGLPTLDGMLLARHRVIDRELAAAIDAGEVSQIVEVACGLSPRGWRFAERYGDRITYIEADLPDMVANKQRILAKLGGESEHHRTQVIDALADSGPISIDAICAQLDPQRGTAIITEGLVNYFDRATVIGMWTRFARALAQFPHGLYLSDLILGEANHGLMIHGFAHLLSVFVRGRVHLHFDDTEDAEAALVDAGFAGQLIDPRSLASELPDLEQRGAGRVRIVRAVI